MTQQEKMWRACEARAVKHNVEFIGTVRDFIGMLEKCSQFAVVNGLDYDPCDDCEPLTLLFPDGSKLKAPRTWDAWGIVGAELRDDERRNPIVVAEHGALYSFRSMALECKPLKCPKCGYRHAVHDGVLLTCQHCNWRKELK